MEELELEEEAGEEEAGGVVVSVMPGAGLCVSWCRKKGGVSVLMEAGPGGLRCSEETVVTTGKAEEGLESAVEEGKVGMGRTEEPGRADEDVGTRVGVEDKGAEAVDGCW